MAKYIQIHRNTCYEATKHVPCMTKIACNFEAGPSRRRFLPVGFQQPSKGSIRGSLSDYVDCRRQWDKTSRGASLHFLKSTSVQGLNKLRRLRISMSGCWDMYGKAWKHIRHIGIGMPRSSLHAPEELGSMRFEGRGCHFWPVTGRSTKCSKKITKKRGHAESRAGWIQFATPHIGQRMSYGSMRHH